MPSRRRQAVTPAESIIKHVDQHAAHQRRKQTARNARRNIDEQDALTAKQGNHVQIGTRAPQHRLNPPVSDQFVKRGKERPQGLRPGIPGAIS